MQLNENILNVKKDIERTKKVLQANKDIYYLIEEINQTKKQAIEAYKKQHDNCLNYFEYCLYYELLEDNIKLCKLLLDKLYDVLAYIDYIDYEEITYFLHEYYNFKLFNPNKIEEYL